MVLPSLFGLLFSITPFCCLPPPVCRQNEVLWREVVSLRQNHTQQQKVMNKVGLCMCLCLCVCVYVCMCVCMSVHACTAWTIHWSATTCVSTIRLVTGVIILQFKAYYILIWYFCSIFLWMNSYSQSCRTGHMFWCSLCAGLPLCAMREDTSRT